MYNLHIFFFFFFFLATTFFGFHLWTKTSYNDYLIKRFHVPKFMSAQSTQTYNSEKYLFLIFSSEIWQVTSMLLVCCWGSEMNCLIWIDTICSGMSVWIFRVIMVWLTLLRQVIEVRYIVIFFLFLHKNIGYWYSLEVPHLGTSNEYPQLVFRKKLENYYVGI